MILDRKSILDPYAIATTELLHMHKMHLLEEFNAAKNIQHSKI